MATTADKPGRLFCVIRKGACVIPLSFAKEICLAEEKLDLLKGTLDLLVLQILSSMGPTHGYGIARRLEQISGDQLAMNEGTIYASLVRMQHRRLIKTAWGTSENNRRAKYYSLTRAGEKALAAEAANWERLASVIGRVLATSGLGQ